MMIISKPNCIYCEQLLIAGDLDYNEVCDCPAKFVSDGTYTSAFVLKNNIKTQYYMLFEIPTNKLIIRYKPADLTQLSEIVFENRIDKPLSPALIDNIIKTLIL